MRPADKLREAAAAEARALKAANEATVKAEVLRMKRLNPDVTLRQLKTKARTSETTVRAWLLEAGFTVDRPVRMSLDDRNRFKGTLAKIRSAR